MRQPPFVDEPPLCRTLTPRQHLGFGSVAVADDRSEGSSDDDDSEEEFMAPGCLVTPHKLRAAALVVGVSGVCFPKQTAAGLALYGSYIYLVWSSWIRRVLWIGGKRPGQAM